MVTRVYATSKNTGPSWKSNPVHLLYLGTSVEEAEKAVGNFTKYQRQKDEFPKEFPKTYSALPQNLEREMIQYYMADGWWCSIEMFELS